jgi:2-dehydropantoate 2-reductase
MKIAIVGAGSIGGTLGALLADAGHEVVLLARGAHLQALRCDGLRYVDRIEPQRSGLRPLPASDDAAAFGTQDLVIITLKAHAIAAMLPRLDPLLAPHTVVLPAINGLPWWYFHREPGRHEGRSLRSLDPQASMFADLDCARVLGCVVHVAAEVSSPGEVTHTAGRRLIVGEIDRDRTGSERQVRVCAALTEAGFEVEASNNIRLAMWVKLLGNLSFNPVAALTGYVMNQICADEGVLALIRTLMLEGMAVSQRLGYPMSITPDQRIDMARQLGAAKISMLQDLEQRRTLELAAIVEAVIELAEIEQLPVPTIRLVHALTAARAKALGIG